MMKTTSSIQLVAPPSGASYTSPACRAYSLELGSTLCDGSGTLSNVREGDSESDWTD